MFGGVYVSVCYFCKRCAALFAGSWSRVTQRLTVSRRRHSIPRNKNPLPGILRLSLSLSAYVCVYLSPAPAKRPAKNQRDLSQ